MRILWSALACVLWSTAAQAATTAPDEVVKTTTAALQKVIGQRQQEFRADPNKLYAVMDELVVPRFDLRYIAQLILARHWKDASDEQRARFEVAFKNMLMRTYADALIEFHDSVKTEWQPLTVPPEAQSVTVESRVLRESGAPLPIGFALRLKDGEWKIYDIIIENLSLITNFRSQVSSEIRKTGLDGLIQKLERGQDLGAPKSRKTSG